MSSTFVFTVVILTVLGGVLAVVLYLVARRFKVTEDPRIAQVEEVLPGANCGGCGSAGCHNFAERCVVAEGLDDLYCPVGGNPVMSKVAAVLGKAVAEKTPMVAVLRCNGCLEARPKRNELDAYPSCAVSAALYEGETGCRYGCLGFGDCVKVCQFGAIHVNEATGLVEVDEEKCTACGACVRKCPKQLLQLRPKGPKSRRLYVACRSLDKGAVARKACKNACIGCGKCAKVCAFDAITIADNLAYIDFAKCKLCRKCAAECPTGAIHELNFPPRPAPKPAEQPVAAAVTAQVKEVIQEGGQHD